KPEIIYENAGIVEIDPRDEAAIARVCGSAEPKFVTVADGIDLPVIAAFRLLAARLDARHPILLKDVLPVAQASSLPSRASLPGSSNAPGSSDAPGSSNAPGSSDASGRMPDAAGWKPALPFLNTLLTAATN